ncbi:hypothetical protein NP233_g4372 [Leucocoprinus birnbaumii]|uniref:RecQ-mediated genome instability protein 1 n=1 Tax=Leucocoprinus birnbaumii TaxID=56174 RepID=A0AAD5VYJ4_9AGAR|nr:hypothetical protein NP233_g4372 [Leucocoprinus birnbaumii]
MAEPPPHVAGYLEQRFPRPRVDREWLQGCYEWLISQPGADASSQKFLDDIVHQLLQSDLRDSMTVGTGPPPIGKSEQRLAGSPVLVEIAAITEIAHSAYQLEQIRAAREERMRIGQTDEDGEGDGDLEIEGEGPMPKYPRGMLKFELSDGATTLSAIEFRSLPQLALGKTPLGYKMLLKNPLARNGIVFLEPNTVELLGHQTVDREVLQNSDFKRGLRVRMGLPDPLDNPPQQPTPQQLAPVAPPARSPLREISPPPEPPLNPTYNDDVNLENRRRKLPSTNSTLVPTQASIAPTATLVASRNPVTTSQYFSNPNLSSSANNLCFSGLNLGPTTAQVSQAPAQDEFDEDDEALFSHFDNSVFLAAPDPVPDENVPPALHASSSDPKPTQPTSFPTPMMSGSSSTLYSGPNTNARPTQLTRSLAPEDSIEIVSFTSSQLAPSFSQPRTQSKNKWNGKERATASSSQASSSGPVIDISGELDLDPSLLEGLDEVEAMRFADPEFKRRQQDELDRLGGSTLTKPAGKGRPIKPLPKPRKSLQSSQGSSQPGNSQSRSRSQTQDVIELDSDSSTSSVFRITDTKTSAKTRGGRNINIDVSDPEEDYHDEYYEEEQYDKENMPVETRHVRRKIANSEGASLSGGLFARNDRKGSGDVIELSDDD